MKPAIALVALFAVSACASPSPEQIAAEQTAQCVGYGFTPGTQEMAVCRMAVAQQKAQRVANARSMMGLAIMQSSGNMAANLQAQEALRQQQFMFRGLENAIRSTAQPLPPLGTYTP